MGGSVPISIGIGERHGEAHRGGLEMPILVHSPALLMNIQWTKIFK